MKAWELDLGGKQLRLAAIEHDGRYYALEGACPRCAFDLWKGKIVTAEAAEGGSAPARVACPVCSTTYELATGTAGEPIKEKGFNGWLGGLAQAATATNAVGRVKTIPVRAGVGGEGGVQLDFTKFK